MPELPEVETTVRGIAPYIEGQTVSEVIIRQNQLRWPISSGLEDRLKSLVIRSVSRKAKYLLFKTDNGSVIVHLGMSGSLRILSANKEPTKHDHVDFVFRNGILMRFNDPRRFGAIIWTSLPPEEHSLLKNCGPEPLSAHFNEDYLYQRAKGRKVSVKSFIMDSHVVVGVGNIYANEALFMAGIHPTRHAGKISCARYKLLVECIKTVLQEAIDQGGTTLRNFVNEAGKPGYFKQQLRVYGRGNEPCTQCSSPLNEIRISQRSTVFCSHCQT